MSDDPVKLWKEQPVSSVELNLGRVIRRRTAELHAATRGEIAASLLAAIAFVGVMRLRVPPLPGYGHTAVLAATVIWVAVSAYRFRHYLLRRTPPADSLAITGLEHYRRELQRRRDHLRSAWLWHGPLLLALCHMAVTIAIQDTRTLLRAAPLLLLLAVWIVYGLVHRLAQAADVAADIATLDE